MSVRRIEKVSALLQREVSQILNNDFAENYGLITITDIEVTADFKEAKIFVSLLDQDSEAKFIKEIGKKASGYQRLLGRKLKMRYTPKLSFIIDRYQEKVDRVDEILKDIDHGS